MAMINDLKDFEKFLKICRRRSVDKVTLDGMSVEFSYLPNQKEDEEVDSTAQDSLSPEDMAFYHLGDK